MTDREALQKILEKVLDSFRHGLNKEDTMYYIMGFISAHLKETKGEACQTNTENLKA